MATNFPSSLDALTNPTSGSALNSPSHADQHADANDAIEALQAKVGVNGSAVTTSLDYKVTNGIMSSLNVDSGTLVVDATNNRVGVNVSSPAHALDVVGRVETRSAATQDGVAIVGRAGGTSSFDVALTPTTLTADRTMTLPDVSGTAITTGNLSSITSTGTLSSLTVTGDLIVDTNTLRVDSTNNRVGVNVTSPAVPLDVVGRVEVRAAATQDGVALAGRAGGTSSYEATLTPTTLTADRTLTLPDETGTVALTSLVPAGCIMQYGASSAPSGWLLCDGTAVSRSTYATLFGIISTTYGTGDGSTTFNLPNLKGRVPVGRDAAQTEFDTMGETGGAKTHTLTSAESGVPAHSHPISDPGHFHSFNVWVFFVQTALVSGFQTTTNTGVLPGTVNTDTKTTGITVSNNTAANASSAHNNLQPYIVLNYIIKT